MTNREWLASLSDEQLIKAIRSFKEDTCCMCKNSNMWGSDCDCLCFDGQVAWLSMEHNDEWEERDYWYFTGEAKIVEEKQKDWECHDCLHFPCHQSDEPKGKICENFELW